MSLIDELIERVDEVFRQQWSHVDARVVPETKSLPLQNGGKKLEATVLYADIDSSTDLVQNYSAEFAAEVYKTFLYCSSRIISSEDGQIRSFDGDRVMGVFVGESKNTQAARAGLKINYAVKKIINPRLRTQYPDLRYKVLHTVGIDVSEMLAVRVGYRNANDVTWVGNAANQAAKLNSLSSEYATRITKPVYDRLHESSKFGGSESKNMWEPVTWNEKHQIFRSNWTWKV